ncbi:MAG: DUF3616 domain-containing protein [Rhodovibrio sp.]|nr:DUF3616 domain-containing protein [Rhodovibrio sp.]
MMWASMLTAGLVVFVDVMKELPATLVMRPFDFDTLAVQAYNLAADERLTEASTAALAIVAVGILPVILLSKTIAKCRPGGCGPARYAVAGGGGRSWSRTRLCRRASEPTDHSLNVFCVGRNGHNRTHDCTGVATVWRATVLLTVRDRVIHQPRQSRTYPVTQRRTCTLGARHPHHGDNARDRRDAPRCPDTTPGRLHPPAPTPISTTHRDSDRGETRESGFASTPAITRTCRRSTSRCAATFPECALKAGIFGWCPTKLWSLERLTADADGGYAEHRSYDLSAIFDLPGDTEIDLEGLAVRDGWVWLVGSHALKRKKPRRAGRRRRRRSSV